MIRRFLLGQMLRRTTGSRLQVDKVNALMRLPTLLRLSYVLFRDERVPLWLRGTTLGSIAFIFSPLDLPGDLPVVGQVWGITLAVMILEWFIQLAPADVVNEHIMTLRLEKKVPLRRV